MLSLSYSDQSWKSSWFFSVCWLLSPQQLTGSTWSYRASQQSCNGIHSLAWVNACTGEKNTALEIGSKMVCCGQTGNKTLSKNTFLPLPHIFKYKDFSYALWWIGNPGLAVWLQQWGGGSWRWGCSMPCRTNTDLHHSQWRLADISLGAVIPTLCPTDPWGFADCFWKVLQTGLKSTRLMALQFKFTIPVSVFPLENYGRLTTHKTLKFTDM